MSNVTWNAAASLIAPGPQSAVHVGTVASCLRRYRELPTLERVGYEMRTSLPIPLVSVVPSRRFGTATLNVMLERGRFDTTGLQDAIR